eukprot:scaffold1066_cov421-Prasinococcus_capsulatus_cf.AAC.10
MEDDVLSLEWRGAYKELMVDGDTACILALARAVMKLQCLFGVIPHVRAKGDFAVYTSELMDRMRKEMQSDSSTCLPISSTISNVIILDRQLDRITPLMTPLTYEGLLDEVFGIRNGSIEVDPAIMGKESTPSGSGPTATASPRVKVPLNGSDSTFREVRDLNFGKTSELLQEKVKRIKSDYTSTRAHSSIGEIKSFVKKLHAMPELQRHVALAGACGRSALAPHARSCRLVIRKHVVVDLSADALNQATGQFGFRQKLEMEQGMLEAVTEYLEEGIEEAEEKVFKQEPLERALRLACLASVIGEGVGRRNLEGLKRAVLHSYGYQHLVTLENLDKAQLLRRHVNRGPFKDVCRGLKLVVDELDNENPEDIAYTHAVQAYAPLSVRLVELALRDSVAGDGWLGKEAQEILEKLPGAFRDYYQRTETDGNATVVQNVTKSSSSSQLAPSASMSQEHLGGHPYGNLGPEVRRGADSQLQSHRSHNRYCERGLPSQISDDAGVSSGGGVPAERLIVQLYTATGETGGNLLSLSPGVRGLSVYSTSSSSSSSSVLNVYISALAPPGYRSEDLRVGAGNAAGVTSCVILAKGQEKEKGKWRESMTVCSRPHGAGCHPVKVLPRFELRLPDSESGVITTRL